MQNNKCPKNYSMEKTFKFDLKNGFCPASFDAIYPPLLSSNKKSVKVTCPSHKVKIIYEINTKEENNGK